MRSSGQFGDVLLRIHLNVEPRNLRAAHAEQRESGFVIGIDQFMTGRGGRSQNS